MQDLHIKGPSGKRLCEGILEIDGSIIFASIGSLSGFEIASASKASRSLLIGDDISLREKYCSIATVVINSFKQAESMFGKTTRIAVSFEKNLRIIIIPIVSEEIFVLLVTTRESDVKTLAFQISKRFERFNSSS